MIGNNLSALGITAAQLTRNFAYAASIWWMPTTHEFGPNGGFDDWEYHEHLATRFGVSATRRATRIGSATSSPNAPENTTIRLADSLNLFETGSLAPGVTVENVRYRMLSADAGLKYRGIFLQAQLLPALARRLPRRRPPARRPRSSTSGFYLQAAFYPVKHKLELYGATSWVFGDKRRGLPTAARVPRRRELVLRAAHARHPPQRAADLTSIARRSAACSATTSAARRARSRRSRSRSSF